MKICQTNSSNCAVVWNKCFIVWKIVSTSIDACPKIFGKVGDFHEFYFSFEGLGDCVKLNEAKGHPAWEAVNYHSNSNLYKEKIDPFINNKFDLDYKMFTTSLIPGVCVN